MGGARGLHGMPRDLKEDPSQSQQGFILCLLLVGFAAERAKQHLRSPIND